MILQENYTLNNGIRIPKIGLGTWMIADKKVSQVDFVISDEDMEHLKNMKKIEDYGKASAFPIYQ